jgi:hypothetical protein
VALPVRQRRLHRDRPHRIAPYLPIGTRPGRPCGGWVTDANVSVPQRRTWPRSMIENACAPHAAHSTRSGCSLASRRHRLPHSQTISYSCVRPVTTMVYQDPRSPSRKLARAPSCQRHMPGASFARPKMALPVAHRRGVQPRWRYIRAIRHDGEYEHASRMSRPNLRVTWYAEMTHRLRDSPAARSVLAAVRFRPLTVAQPARRV